MLSKTTIITGRGLQPKVEVSINATSDEVFDLGMKTLRKLLTESP
jgi:hypothetical protein